MGETPVAGEHFGSALADLQSSGRSRGFAELVAALNALNNLESSLATAIARARVPVQEVRTLADGTILADGLALVEDVNAQLGTHFDASEVDSLGGLVFSRLGRRPRVGDEVDLGSGYRARVERLDGLRVARVRLLPTRQATPPPGGDQRTSSSSTTDGAVPRRPHSAA